MLERISLRMGLRHFPSSSKIGRGFSYLRIYGISLRLVAIKSDHRKLLSQDLSAHRSSLSGAMPYRLNLSRIYLNDPNPGCNQLPPQCIRKGPYRSLCGAIDAATSVWLSSGDASNIDDVTPSSLFPFLEDWENGLRHIY